MRRIDERFCYPTTPKSDAAQVVKGDCYRFTVLAPELIRMEYSPEGHFEDRATQTVVNRAFPPTPFTVQQGEERLVLETASLRLEYDKQPFTPAGLCVRLRGDGGAVWHYGDEVETLGGTARTLDEVDGPVALGPGVLAKGGFALLDDSASLTLCEDGWVEPRHGAGSDLYFFGYGRRYRECLAAFYRLCGPPPLVPRYALGNWWSRYHPYTEAGYKALMERFEGEGVPLSVAVIDMDWHLVDIDPKYGTGWTGYTWNHELFPDPPAFLAWLHEKGLKTTLNLHPADGVRAHEQAYPALATALGKDIEAEEPVAFDITNPDFLQAYFTLLHHPLEEQGVDFWWVDWQQGEECAVPGLDPLWMLNHYHYIDSARRGKRPMTFSRYAGVGSHRYPLGFSGDSIVTWESLDFQPYFTATASNIGYGWWSHDIGGHMFGYRCDELATRWVQFGVFSPVCRLHSSDSPFGSKEPWAYNATAREAMVAYLRLRHALVPYLYTMNRRASREGQPLVQPMYYEYPHTERAYTVPNQYLFGSELMVCPITQPTDPALCRAPVEAWLPDGLWFDLFSGRRYGGGRALTLWRPLRHIPVLARAGAVVPLDGAAPHNGTANPETLEVLVFPGADGGFTLWEDDGDSPQDRDEHWAATEMAWHFSRGCFTIKPAVGNLAQLPAARSWTLRFKGLVPTCAEVLVDGCPAGAQAVHDGAANTLSVTLAGVPVASEITVRLADVKMADNTLQEDIFDLLLRAQLPLKLKEDVYSLVRPGVPASGVLAGMEKLDGMTPALVSAVAELLG